MGWKALKIRRISLYSTTISMVTTVGPYYGTPSKILSPIIASIGLRAKF